jgi:hypothetical protein
MLATSRFLNEIAFAYDCDALSAFHTRAAGQLMSGKWPLVDCCRCGQWSQ